MTSNESLRHQVATLHQQLTYWRALAMVSTMAAAFLFFLLVSK